MNSLKRNTGKHHMTALILTACILSGLALAVPVLRIKRALFG